MAEIKKLKCVINGKLSKEACHIDGGRKRQQRDRTASSSTHKVQKKQVQHDHQDNEHEQEHEPNINFRKREKLMFTITEIYSSLLKTKSAITPVSNDLKAFLVQSFDEVKNVLKNYYVIMERRIIKISDRTQWVYSCSCDQARHRLIWNLPETIEEDFNKDGGYEECIHVKSAKNVIEEFHPGLDTPDSSDPDKDDHAYGKNKTKIDIFGIPDNNSIVCVRWEEAGVASYHIIRVDYTTATPELKCVTCRINNCVHCKEVLKQDINASDLPTNILHALNEATKWRSRYVPVSVSSKKIPFSCCPEEQKANRGVSFVLDTIHLKPEPAVSCFCGGHLGEPILVDEVKIFTGINILDAKVYSSYCTESNCNGIKEYDGCEDQILNMGSYMVTHDVLRDFLRQFVTQGCTMASFYKQWCWRQLESGNLNFKDECPYNRFRYAWYSFLKILDIDYKKGFICSQCGECPETVVMDGVCLGLRKSFMPWKSDSSTHFDMFDGSSHNTRVFINNHETRQLLLKFVEKTLTDKEMNLLKQKVALYQPSLSQLINRFHEDGVFSSPPILKDFLLILSSNYPVCGFIHYNLKLFEVLENLDNFSTSDIVLLERETPVISSLFKNYSWKVPLIFRPIFKELVSVAKAPFRGESHKIPLCGENCDCRGIGSFPHLPTISHRGMYVLDSKLKRKQNGNCTKRKSSHPTLIPGLFTVSCIHGVCYGYDVMENPESPNIPFTILRTRFQKAPKLIIYDNACNLHEYCLNRDPVFFRDSWFVIDRFHWCNHVGCHAGYNLDNYPQFKDVNTQVAEQRNSTLNKLKSMLSYMNVDNFKAHLNLFIWFRSMLTVANLEHESFFDDDLMFFKELSKVYSNIWGR